MLAGLFPSFMFSSPSCSSSALASAHQWHFMRIKQRYSTHTIPIAGRLQCVLCKIACMRIAKIDNRCILCMPKRSAEVQGTWSAISVARWVQQRLSCCLLAQARHRHRRSPNSRAPRPQVRLQAHWYVEHLHQTCFTASTHAESRTHRYCSPSGRYGRNTTARMAQNRLTSILHGMY